MTQRVELVFRSVGERTSKLALELAKEHIRPDRVHIIESVKPFSAAVDQMLRIEHECDVVVHMDADCLIFEDMRPFLNWNTEPYVDSYVWDRFRGRIHCGVHITRIDVVEEMKKVRPPTGDHAYVLRPESRLRNVALERLSGGKRFKGFRILHDHHQSFESIWEKYALRELRSRTDKQRARLEGAMARWDDAPDYRVARHAVEHTRRHIPEETATAEVAEFICQLPELAKQQLSSLDLPPQSELTRAEAEASAASIPEVNTHKVFGLGLSRTGTRSLTAALHVLGFDTLHYPTDAQTLADLERGDGRFDFLDHFDGLTDITASPYYAQLDAQYPGSKFILTTRPMESWLRSAKNHWSGRPAHDDLSKSDVHLGIRRLLRASTYGCYDFQPERFAWVHEEHVRRVREHFAGREDFLELPVTSGAGWQPLCDFLDVPFPSEPFPHKGGMISKRLAQLEVGD